MALAGPLGEPLDLLDDWEGADLAIVVDAVRSGAPPGTVTLNWLGEALDALSPARSRRPSTHGLGVADVYRLAVEMGVAPQRVALVGVEGQDFSHGEGLSAPVHAGVARATALVVDVVRGAVVAGN